MIDNIWSSIENAINFFEKIEDETEKTFKNEEVSDFFFDDQGNQDKFVSLKLENNCLFQLNKNISLFKNLKKLEIKNNRLRIFHCNILPDSLEEFIFSNNNTIGIAGFKNGLKYINLSGNDFKEIYCNFPKTLEKLDISKNTNFSRLPRIEKLENLKIINLSHTKISNIDALPNCIEELFANNTNLTQILKFPDNLLCFNGCHANLIEITAKFPAKLREFDIYFNNIEFLQDFPDTIENLDLSNNKLKTIPFFPKTTTLVDLSCNPLDIETVDKLKDEYKNTSIIFSEKKNTSENENTTEPKIVKPKFTAVFCESNPHFIVHTTKYEV